MEGVSLEPADPMSVAWSTSEAKVPSKVATSMTEAQPDHTTKPYTTPGTQGDISGEVTGPSATPASPLDNPDAGRLSHAVVHDPAHNTAEQQAKPWATLLQGTAISGIQAIETDAAAGRGRTHASTSASLNHHLSPDAEDVPCTSSASAPTFSKPGQDEIFSEAREACDSILFCEQDADPSYTNLEVKPVEGQGVPSVLLPADCKNTF